METMPFMPFMPFGGEFTNRWPAMISVQPSDATIQKVCELVFGTRGTQQAIDEIARACTASALPGLRDTELGRVPSSMLE